METPLHQAGLCLWRLAFSGHFYQKEPRSLWSPVFGSLDLASCSQDSPPSQQESVLCPAFWLNNTPRHDRPGRWTSGSFQALGRCDQGHRAGLCAVCMGVCAHVPRADTFRGMEGQSSFHLRHFAQMTRLCESSHLSTSASKAAISPATAARPCRGEAARCPLCWHFIYIPVTEDGEQVFLSSRPFMRLFAETSAEAFRPGLV